LPAGPTASTGVSAKARAHAARGSAIRDANDRYCVDVVKRGSDGGTHGHGRRPESDGDARSKNAFDSFAPRKTRFWSRRAYCAASSSRSRTYTRVSSDVSGATEKTTDAFSASALEIPLSCTEPEKPREAA
jgi:hypothetical protein